MRGITPVAGSFSPRSIGTVALDSERQRPDGGRDDLFGVLRVRLGNRQRADDQSPVTDLVPVVFTSYPPAFLICSQSGFQAVPDEAGLDFFSRPGVHIGVEPVITEPDGVGHLGRIEKVRWIPVLECTNRQHVIDGFDGVFFLARPSVSKAESVNPVQTFSADMKQPGADLPVRKHGFAGTIVRLFENIFHAFL